MPISVELEKCVGCKLCYTICPQDVFSWKEAEKKPHIEYQYECAHCGICYIECPKRAINLTLPATFY